ncbi:hypothetical protein CVT25_004545 [Psilocybe cyanescens]|uniref:Uncharacterized protein n=1 Tax=Psilocybe cyanescens TaxID=93625 RepID=A0A409VYC7_PSICY|nr:hypothetical protein CVT25_004545 [Psilocybe cyanescens]
MAPKTRKGKGPALAAAPVATEEEIEYDIERGGQSDDSIIPGAFQEGSTERKVSKLEDELVPQEVTPMLTQHPPKIPYTAFGFISSDTNNPFTPPRRSPPPISPLRNTALFEPSNKRNEPTTWESNPEEKADDEPAWVVHPTAHKAENTQVKFEEREVFIPLYESLKEIEGPLEDLSSNPRYYDTVTVDLPAARPAETIAFNGTEGNDRWKEAMRLGADYLLRRSTNLSLSRSDRRNFKNVLQRLQEILSRVNMYCVNEYKGYKLIKKDVINFGKGLMTLREAAREQLEMEGDGVPALPKWGKDNNLNEYWKPNDFEILAACYREEVTQFLARLGKSADFKVMTAFEHDIDHDAQYHETQSIQNPPAPKLATAAQAVPRQQQTQSDYQKPNAPTTDNTMDKIQKEAQTSKAESEEEVRRRKASKERFRKSEVTRHESVSMYRNTPRTAKVRAFTNQNASIFGHPSQHTAS